MFDKRIVRRLLEKGQITPADHKSYLDSLPDCAAQAAFVDYGDPTSPSHAERSVLDKGEGQVENEARSDEDE
ncbi:MAG: hypothetical protein N2515_08260 [Deltaproteobacteria bacterium]|nr:hypothetical protein [Deltaproteobacteria bacterium]